MIQIIVLVVLVVLFLNYSCGSPIAPRTKNNTIVPDKSGHYHRDGYGNAVYIATPYRLCNECKKRKEQKFEDYNRYDVYGPDFG